MDVDEAIDLLGQAGERVPREHDEAERDDQRDGEWDRDLAQQLHIVQAPHVRLS
ncbi:hypothetical protein [Methylobacterium durans]|uniref:hypothetical protein n=1 Tax=Methylobacterium durans TaxID=2202825 RepID=UPI003002A327